MAVSAAADSPAVTPTTAPPAAAAVDNEVPQDLKAFFGHPLNSSLHSNDSSSGALALLHEYKSLPAIDKGLHNIGGSGGALTAAEEENSCLSLRYD